MDLPRPNDAFDRELRRTLAASGRSASSPHVDAELAAAWMDRRLDPAAALSVEAHLAGCADCQALFATLARIEPEEPATPAALAWWRRARTGWLVPATVAAAAAFVIWVAVPQQRSANLAEPPSQPRTQSEVAQAPAPPVPAPSAEADTAADARVAPSRSQPQAKAVAPLAESAATRQLERRELADTSAIPSFESKESIAVAGETPTVDAQRSRRAAVGAAESATAPAAPAAVRQDTAAAARDLRANAELADGLRGSALTVVAADGAARWRRTGTRLEFAPRADAGFTPVALPVAADAIVAGSSPGGATCWFVGSDGLVLVTSDGVRFARVAAPAATALVGVTATDARSATVTVGDGRRFRTGDAGATWTALP